MVIVAKDIFGSPMTNLTTIRQRLAHVEAIIETANQHIDSPGDEYALTRALGLLEQTFADLDDLAAEDGRSSDT